MRSAARLACSADAASRAAAMLSVLTGVRAGDDAGALALDEDDEEDDDEKDERGGRAPWRRA